MEKVVYGCTTALRRKFTFLTLSRKFTSSHQTSTILLVRAHIAPRVSQVYFILIIAYPFSVTVGKNTMYNVVSH